MWFIKKVNRLYNLSPIIMKSPAHTNSLTDENLIKFSSILARKTNDGFVVVERNDKLPYAVLLKKEQRVNHSFNFIICCITLGLWSFVWLYMSKVSSRAKKILVAIDEDGNPFEEKCYMG